MLILLNEWVRHWNSWRSITIRSRLSVGSSQWWNMRTPCNPWIETTKYSMVWTGRISTKKRECCCFGRQNNGNDVLGCERGTSITADSYYDILRDLSEAFYGVNGQVCALRTSSYSTITLGRTYRRQNGCPPSPIQVDSVSSFTVFFWPCLLIFFFFRRRQILLVHRHTVHYGRRGANGGEKLLSSSTPEFYADGLEIVVYRYSKCLDRLGIYVEK